MPRVGRHVVLAALVLAGCEREPLDVDCPDVEAGELVISELRGAQSGPDTFGQWIELYNASGRSVSLGGLFVRVQRIDGGAEANIVVRRRDVEVAAGDYVVLGQAEDGLEPEHMDYGYLIDFDADLYDDGGVTVESCGVQIDRVIYRDLPDEGTLSLDGAVDPNAADNDEANAGDAASPWCVDDTADAGGGDLGLPGTPGERNRTCS